VSKREARLAREREREREGVTERDRPAWSQERASKRVSVCVKERSSPGARERERDRETEGEIERDRLA
jgi:hypothetical protein